MDYKLTVGLEIHAELKTRTKMFCDSKNDPDEKSPNANICPVCMGYPGTLPVINREAVKSILRLGVAVGGKLADYAEFDRKNYFYPDIPKGYQISQYKHPLISGGELSGVKLTRIHLEEDTARSTHDKGEESLVDFNRAGVPLMELVTEPVIHSAEEAASFAKELQLLLQYLGISEANMEKGEMRVEANVSVSKTSDFGTKVEVKNLNSFRATAKAIDFEYKRQVELIDKGEKVAQETRGWDENAGETFSQRAKEESHDYRYFPDPDLPKLFIKEIPEFSEENLKATLPELPWDRRRRLLNLGVSPEHAEIYVTQPEWGTYFGEVSQTLKEPELIITASNYITSELKTPIDANEFAETVRMIGTGEISSKGAKEILKILQAQGGEARAIAEKNNLMQISDRGQLQKFAEEAVTENKEAPIQFLVGQVIKKSGGRANPAIAQELLLEMLNR
ncbi:MAG: hypothetical protein A3J09_00180 [Candidatus Zambryskibacteria bacterium RIFCSPLOWO2_02_FULL_51_21]|uniref:Aspartyl/glutamyl-tRNA(Asn/Gln) amidotransferase subunit B n=1 Tax=Candidatus Zambryskibacteria bacterium RIFCSPHIGHO2_02_FULL_43_37 TaxID=1802749 RepID=A0A1G2THW5_9BACT|nr:MAG: hypothetical protein A2723_00180 [Candidatus Zambryskibacteria bacterium RIFCSPHIGHO2_01_FULL_52_18]OHA96877.1 MAG: hypothetical protein A3D49_02080 [Candidatus Zambryskibacteria bacterium RIFCSPHIGHO2_02_FULL_43_37]OHB07065.1 MAG: hypothetical protein A2944_02275 [Candidatus Zambryskibacteria bacterium RIFCSPLOWO2_01_FULL_52_12]OHB10989.1 MAG: hypothetical protein A3J09_00180 [Candidatus Zambryskibacteria bacterium RIFCSPLOWO2_02_FULL_51_21]